ncbi:MAG TPA: hypothetical protein VHR55_08770 [Candidatus Limnocylindria bacterium]|nr:hypothetical protein [Candidatus Limnocylindria bacterium]
MALFAAALLLTAHSAGYVRADHSGHPFGSTANCSDPPGKIPANCVSVGNTMFHYVYVSPLVTGDLRQSLLDTIWQDYNPTDLTMSTETTISSLTDVEAYAADYNDNGVAGWVVCPADSPQGINAHSDRWCQKQEMRFNKDPIFAAFFADDPSRDHIVCHELGHTLGLQHWGNPPASPSPTAATCMNVNTPNGPVNLHQTDKDHINGYY